MKEIHQYITEKLHLRKGIQNTYNEESIKITTYICYFIGVASTPDSKESIDFVKNAIANPEYPLHYYIIKINEWAENRHVKDFNAYLSEKVLEKWSSLYGKEIYKDDKVVVDNYKFANNAFDIMGSQGTKVDMHGHDMEGCTLFIKDDTLIFHEYTKDRQHNRQNLTMIFVKK